MSSVLILGGASDIAQAVAREYARNGFDIQLALRQPERLTTLQSDLTLRYKVSVQLHEFDILAMDSHQQFYSGLDPKPAGVVCAIGYLGSQELAERDFQEARLIIDTNFTGCVSILNHIANDFVHRGQGFITGISSVAGDRGRKANYIYGSAKGAFTTYLSGLRNRLHGSGVQVLTVKPGFVDTRMTRDMELPERLTAQPEEVAALIYKAQKRKKDVLYATRIWRYIMLVIRHIPELLFKRLSI